jgi:Ni,Fe-hydrogenase III small subunit
MMLNLLLERLRQKYRTHPYPAQPPVLPERFRGRPELRALDDGLITEWEHCEKACPTGALALRGNQPGLDMGKCLFCGLCERESPSGLVRFTRDWRLASSYREDLVVTPLTASPPRVDLAPELRALFVRSFRLRQVTAGGCGACEADLNVLTTLVFDLDRFGISFVASPRHADALAVTGPNARNMQTALNKVDAATPDPHLVLAVGACAISGGIFRSEANPHNANGITGLEVALYIPGCPSHPYTNLDGFLRLLGVVKL